MNRNTVLAVSAAVVAIAAMIGLLAFYHSIHTDASRLTRADVRQIISDEIAEAGLAGDALDQRLEEAIVAFVKSRAREGGTASARPAEPSRPENVEVDPIDPQAEPVAGNVDARYQFIVYSDYECPFCKRFDPTLQTLIDRYGKRVAFTVRDYPLSFHGRMAMREAIAAQCVFKLGGNEAFWPYSHAIFEDTASNGRGVPAGTLADLAVDVGVQRDAFTQCMESPDAIRAGIAADIASGKAAGVRGTPASFLLDTKTGQHLVVPGAQPLSAVISVLDRLLGPAEAQ